MLLCRLGAAVVGRAPTDTLSASSNFAMHTSLDLAARSPNTCGVLVNGNDTCGVMPKLAHLLSQKRKPGARPRWQSKMQIIQGRPKAV